MSNFFLGPNFREKVTMGSLNPVELPQSDPKQEPQIPQIPQVEPQDDSKKEPKGKGKQDGKE